MESPNDYNIHLDSAVNKPTAAKRRQRPYFYSGNNNYANINIPPSFVQELHLTTEDEVTLEIITTSDGPGILLRRRKEVRNRSSRPHLSQEADDQDYEE